MRSEHRTALLVLAFTAAFVAARWEFLPRNFEFWMGLVLLPILNGGKSVDLSEATEASV